MLQILEDVETFDRGADVGKVAAPALGPVVVYCSFCDICVS